MGSRLTLLLLSLGVLTLCARMSACLRKIDAVKHTPYIEECAQILLAAGEYKGDIDLVAHVRMQYIIESIDQSLPFDGLNDPKTTKPPIGLCIKPFQIELEKVKTTLLGLSESSKDSSRTSDYKVCYAYRCVTSQHHYACTIISQKSTSMKLG